MAPRRRHYCFSNVACSSGCWLMIIITTSAQRRNSVNALLMMMSSTQQPPPPRSSLDPLLLSVGIDLGTSGARISVLQKSTEKESGKEVFSAALPWKNGAYDDPDLWVSTVQELLRQAADAPLTRDGANNNNNTNIQTSICVSGTSASCLIVDTATGEVSRRPRMYDDAVVDDPTVARQLDAHAPLRHTVRSSTSSLSKLLAWHAASPLRPTERLLHQADYVAFVLACSSSSFTTEETEHSFQNFVSDWHNCLKLGYDVRRLEWPSWLFKCLDSVGLHHSVLPATVLSPGEAVPGRNGRTTTIVAGTTDSNAAFVAGCGFPVSAGTAVSSLGSTVALKQLSLTYVEDAERGVYSHRFPSVLSPEDEERDLWLVGGASNVGCSILRSLNFSNAELEELSKQIDPGEDSPLSYYPLTKRGERFPIADSLKEPLLEPIPPDRAEYLHGVLQGISDVERDGYRALEDLGASPRCHTIWTCGGGSRNEVWTQLRQRRLRRNFPGIVVARAPNVEASYGAALLAEAGVRSLSPQVATVQQRQES